MNISVCVVCMFIYTYTHNVESCNIWGTVTLRYLKVNGYIYKTISVYAYAYILTRICMYIHTYLHLYIYKIEPDGKRDSPIDF